MLGSTHISAFHDSLVELFALEHEEVGGGFDDSALGGDGSSCVYIIARYHAHCDACALTLLDCFRYLNVNKHKCYSRVTSATRHPYSSTSDVPSPF